MRRCIKISQSVRIYFTQDCPTHFEKSEVSCNVNVVSGIFKKMSDYTVRNELEYVGLIMYDKRVKCLKDSGSKLIILRKSLFPDKPSSSRFNESVKVEIAIFSFSLYEGQVEDVEEAAIYSDLSVDRIFPPKYLKLLENSSVNYLPK